MSNVAIKINEIASSASAQCYLTVSQAVPPDLPLQAIFIEHYQDKFARDDAGWYFTHRLITRVLVGNLSFHRAEMS